MTEPITETLRVQFGEQESGIVDITTTLDPKSWRWTTDATKLAERETIPVEVVAKHPNRAIARTVEHLLAAIDHGDLTLGDNERFSDAKWVYVRVGSAWYQIIVRLDRKGSWRWEPEITPKYRRDLIEPDADDERDFTAQSPNRCIGKALEWLLNVRSQRNLPV